MVGEARVPRIGPNSVLQTFRALKELESEAIVAAIAARAEVPDPLPGGMIPEAWFVRLIRIVRETVPPERAEAVLRRSGACTAGYVGQNRIPRPIRWILAVLPRRLAVPILLQAFAQHAWTFAGAGRYAVEGPFPGAIVLDGCPTARAEASPPVTGPACAYYEAAFQGLLELAAPGVRVIETTCQAAGAPRCRFQISFT
jgi:divinyl protochlorophyllide a 8-vinyl-reductase